MYVCVWGRGVTPACSHINVDEFSCMEGCVHWVWVCVYVWGLEEWLLHAAGDEFSCSCGGV